ncbi:MAG: adenosylcobinamide-GDP ribazoletransferase [Planctomycetaceae bacterium]
MSETHSQPSFAARQWEAFCTALQFLTRIPLCTRAPSGADEYRAAIGRGLTYFPLMGAMVTSVTAIAISGLLVGLPVELAVLLALALEALLTGAFHEDALADTCDALGGGWTREQVLTILKDSRLGTYGTLGLGLGVACRFYCLIAIVEHHWFWYGVATVVASGAISRWAMLWLLATVNPIQDRATQAAAVSGPHARRATAVSLLFVAPAVIPWTLLDPLGFAAALGLSALVLAAFRWQVLRRLGGSTGDLVGCSGYLVQLAVLIVAAGRCSSEALA